MQLYYLLVAVVSDINVMSSTVLVIFAITSVVNNYGTKPNSFRTESKFFKNRTETESK